MTTTESHRTIDDYKLIKILEHDGLKARLTRRTSNVNVRQYSYQFYRTYMVGNQEKSTLWLNPRHMHAVSQLMGEIAVAIEEDQANPAEPLDYD